MPDKCLFCKIARKEVPAKIIVETPECMAFHDTNPQAPKHVVVIPKEHIATLNEARNPAIMGKVMLMAADVAKREGIAETGYRTVINTNAGAGQTVFHLHVHVMGGRPMTWPPG
jgi:histidine triad (HIT) family protein